MSPRGIRARRSGVPKRTIWLAAGTVVLAGTGVTAVSVTGGSGGTGADDTSRPARAHTLALDGKDAKKRELPRTETQLFSLVGVSWEDGADDFEGTAQIRTRSAESGTWTGWRDLDFGIRAPETEEGDASGVRGASEPLWVGPSDAVEARVMADGKETAVPDALRLDMIDPGDERGGKGRGGSSGKGGNGDGNGRGKPSAGPATGESASATVGAPPSAGDAGPTTAPEPSAEPTREPTDAPATGQPAASGSPAPSEEPVQEPTAEPSAPAPSEEPPASAPSSPDEQPTTPAPSAEPTQEPTQGATQEPTQGATQEPTEDAATPAPSEEPASEPTSAPTTEPTAEPSAQPEPTGATSPAAPAAPAIVSRAEWGADESLVADPPSYLDKVDAVFVHHTAGTNAYDCVDSPAVVRAILTYHVKTNGWNDIGYNFFVDKCGTVFEGRAGGVDKPVRGAHTYGFNGYSAGVSLLGDYENGGTPSAAAKQAIADLAAWKLNLHGVDPRAEVTLTAAGDTGVYETGEKATLHTVSGHRDGYATLCPGQALYDALPAIRTAAGASRFTTR
ncbi:N-acetylmuramoyl-L-alanine amidase [Streptomyces coelicoflavus]|uniref:N-acetylmuramoyl-L-alanine amidase n=1 Tax=Streptomyces coelicoflavus TaxID=285562 RepID=UPI001FD2C67D|nr:N-acetylmuramoyl-L-alanine amidase [Streptomyces coelicoflavus]